MKILGFQSHHKLGRHLTFEISVILYFMTCREKAPALFSKINVKYSPKLLFLPSNQCNLQLTIIKISMLKIVIFTMENEKKTY